MNTTADCKETSNLLNNFSADIQNTLAAPSNELPSAAPSPEKSQIVVETLKNVEKSETKIIDNFSVLEFCKANWKLIAVAASLFAYLLYRKFFSKNPSKPKLNPPRKSAMMMNPPKVYNHKKRSEPWRKRASPKQQVPIIEEIEEVEDVEVEEMQEPSNEDDRFDDDPNFERL